MSLITKQFAVDLNCSEAIFQQKQNFFTSNSSTMESRYWARGSGNTICYQDQLFCRTEIPQLTKRLQAEFQATPGQWFFERENIVKLEQLLAEFELRIINQAPFFVPAKKLTFTVADDSCFQFLSAAEIPQFQSDPRIKQSFCFDEQDPDQIGLAYYEEADLKAVCGANQNGKYTWEIGIEILEPTSEHQGLATTLVRNLTAKIQAEHPTVLPVYGTQFSHTRSMNTAIRAGFVLGWSELMIGK